MGRDGPVSGIYTGNRQYTGNIGFSQGAAGASFNFIKKDTQIWYVDSGKTSPAVSGNGLTWEQAFMTTAEAVAAAGDFDTILIAPNNIETMDAAGIAITQMGLRIFGLNGSPGRQAAAIKCTGTAAMFRITGDRCEIAGLHLSQRGAYTCIEVGSAADGAVYGTWIHHCSLNGYGTGTYGVSGYDQTADTVNLCVEDCYFSSFATASIHVYGTGDSYVRNVIKVATDTIGIDVKKTGGTRAEGIIADNRFYGVAGGATYGIKFAGNSTAGALMVVGNEFAGTWDTVLSTNTGVTCVQNFQASTTGGSVIDADGG